MAFDKGQVGGILGGVGLIMLLMAFPISNLSGGDNNGFSPRCGYLSIEICDPLCDDEAFRNCVSDHSCQMRDAGLVWLIFTIIAATISLIGLIGIFVKSVNYWIKQYIRYLFLVSAVCCVIAFTTWIGIGVSTGICYNTDWNDRYLGASLILSIGAVVIFVSAAILVWNQHKVGFETLL